MSRTHRQLDRAGKHKAPPDEVAYCHEQSGHREKMSHLTPPVKKTILVVDDETNTREGLRTSLEENYEVYVAPDAAGARAVMQGIADAGIDFAAVTKELEDEGVAAFQKAYEGMLTAITKRHDAVS